MSAEQRTDKDRIDWLQEKIVDVIYLDDSTFIDVRGNSVRAAIDKAMDRDEGASASTK